MMIMFYLGKRKHIGTYKFGAVPRVGDFVEVDNKEYNVTYIKWIADNGSCGVHLEYSPEQRAIEQQKELDKLTGDW